MAIPRAPRRPWLERILTLAAFAYVLALVGWLVLRATTGDRLWPVALTNASAPYLFLPMIPLVPLAALLPWTRLRWAMAVPLVLFLALYGGQLVPRGKPATPSDLEIVTFNVCGNSRSGATALAAVQRGSPDIIALQELSPRMLDVFTEALGEDYPYRHYSNGPWHHRLGILSRYPLETIDLSSWAREDWRIQAARVQVGERDVIVYNVHLAVSNALAYHDNGNGLGAQTAASYRGREEQVDALLHQIAAIDGPVIVLGDFNTTETSDAYAALVPRLTDAHRAAGSGLGHTFPSYGGTWKGLPIPTRVLRLDMILATNHLTPLSCRVLPAFAESDHHPVWAAYGWR